LAESEARQVAGGRVPEIDVLLRCGAAEWSRWLAPSPQAAGDLPAFLAQRPLPPGMSQFQLPRYT
jgi:hypothetical protein